MAPDDARTQASRACRRCNPTLPRSETRNAHVESVQMRCMQVLIASATAILRGSDRDTRVRRAAIGHPVAERTRGSWQSHRRERGLGAVHPRGCGSDTQRLKRRDLHDMGRPFDPRSSCAIFQCACPGVESSIGAAPRTARLNRELKSTIGPAHDRPTTTCDHRARCDRGRESGAGWRSRLSASEPFDLARRPARRRALVASGTRPRACTSGSSPYSLHLHLHC